MSRKKHQVKKGWPPPGWEHVEEPILPIAAKVARYGDRYNQAVFSFLEDAQVALRDAQPGAAFKALGAPIPMMTFDTQNFILRFSKTIPFVAAHLTEKLLLALRNGDVKFFRDLADGIEALRDQPADPLKTFLTEHYQQTYWPRGCRKESPPPTVNQLSERWFTCKHGPKDQWPRVTRTEVERLRPSIERQIRRACRDLKLPLTEGKRGRPKASRKNSDN